MFLSYYHVTTIWNIYTDIRTVHSLLMSLNLDLMVTNNEINFDVRSGRKDKTNCNTHSFKNTNKFSSSSYSKAC